MRHLDVDIAAVEQRTGEAFLVAGDGGGVTGAFAYRVGGIATGTPVRITIILSVADVYSCGNIKRKGILCWRLPHCSVMTNVYWPPSESLTRIA